MISTLRISARAYYSLQTEHLNRNEHFLVLFSGSLRLIHARVVSLRVSLAFKAS